MPDRDWQGETVRAWTRGFGRQGAHAELEEELHRGRMAKRGFNPDGRPTRARPATHGDPLSQRAKPGADTAGGANQCKRRPGPG